jgi:iron-sulfur cluster repair protein YtfE (RIC family)
MDALEVLREMHVEAKTTFQQIEQASPEERGALWAKLRPELRVHEQLEELFVYDPVAREVGGRDEVLTAWEEEHHNQVDEAEKLMSEIGRLEPRDAQWLARVKALRHLLEQHIQKEETEVWPRIRTVWDPDKLEETGSRMQVVKTAASAGAKVSGAVGATGETVKNAAQRITGR